MLAAYALLLLLPNFVWLNVAFNVDTLLYALLIPIALLVSFFSLFGTRVSLACTLLAPFAFLAPIETFYIVKYLHPSTATDLAIVLASNSREAHEYFEVNLFAISLVAVAVAVFILTVIVGLRRSQVAWDSPVRFQIALVAFAIPALMDRSHRTQRHFRVSSRPEDAWARRLAEGKPGAWLSSRIGRARC